MENPAPDIALQINVCAGDIAYADPILRSLVDTHRGDIREVVAVADCCRPQSTPVLHRASRFPGAEFAARVSILRELCARWLQEGLVHRVEYLEAGDVARVRQLNRKYCGRDTSCTHDHLGHAFTAYFAGWDAARSRYVVHFDADILLHQARGYSWLRDAVSVLSADRKLLAVSPRIAPPPADAAGKMVDLAREGIAWMPSWRLTPEGKGWRSDWFSTRCHVIDRDRLAGILPLTPRRGPALDCWGDWLNRCLLPLYDAYPWISDKPAEGLRWFGDRMSRRISRYLIPEFPLPPEVLLYESALRHGLGSYYLGDVRAWYIHPDRKPQEFTELLPRLLKATREGRFPPSQAGFTGVGLTDWRSFD